MARYSVYRLRSGVLVIDCQADGLASLPTRFAAPLVDRKGFPNPIARLHPIFRVAGVEHIMVTHEAGAIRVSEIVETTTSLIDHDIEIANALDMLITGF